MNIRIIGNGYWGPSLVRNFSGIEDCNVTMVADERKERLALAKRTYPFLKVASSAEELIRSADVDAVVVATPSFIHLPLAKSALMNNKHVLVEKPLASSVKLKYLEEWNNRRRAIAKMYHEGITNQKIKMQQIPEWADGNYHLFVITTENKDELVKHSNENNIAPAFHYPVPCHLQKVFSHLEYRKEVMPNLEYLASHCVSLPMIAELADEDVQKVIGAVNQF